MPKTRKKSSLTNVERLSPNRNKPRNTSVRGSTPHHVAGNLTVETILGLSKVTTYDPTNGMSMGYAIGSDGRRGLAVEETNRSWTSSSAVNDHRCITTEIANNGGAPDWRMSDAAINSWLDLTVDQCRFYEFKKVNYQVKPANITPAKVEAWIKTWAKDDEWIITLHNWFAVNGTICPGPYFTRQIPWLVREMNKRLSDDKYIGEAFVGEGNTAVDQVVSKPSSPPKETPKPVATEPKESIVFKPYEITITASALNVRKGPGVDYSVVKTLSNDKNVYTIVEEKDGPAGNGVNSKWGKFKSGLGWILLMYTKRK